MKKIDIRIIVFVGTIVATCLLQAAGNLVEESQQVNHIAQIVHNHEKEQFDRYHVLITAVEHNDLKMVQQAETDGLDMRVIDSDSGQTLLHLAASYGANDVLQFLIDECLLDIIGEDYQGKTPLDYARAHNQKSTIQLLLAYGAEGVQK